MGQFPMRERPIPFEFRTASYYQFELYAHVLITLVVSGMRKSIITPIHNGEAWINDCMESIVGQTALDSLVVQVSIYDDASRDRTWELVQIWKTRIEPIRNISLVASKNTTPHPKGGPCLVLSLETT
uniref:Glycosyltransferase 2-like domain-containing protein n=1 Tax=Timema shepardi TaxID=629360 RepID=A0A7R9AYK4_TIMSH|nr:unnamed protein product [Timema shepardi]